MMRSQKCFFALPLRRKMYFIAVLSILQVMCLLPPVPGKTTPASDRVELQTFPNIGGDFTLTGPDQKNVSLHQFEGKVVLLFFGYRLCPDVCPLTILELKDVLDKLGEDAKKVQIIFVSVDSERDTWETINREWLAFFDPRIIGLTGTSSEIKKVAKLYKVRFKKMKSASAAGLLIGHTAYTFLIDGKGKLRYRFPFKSSSSSIIEGVRQLF